jgi:hypothetical protein
LDGEEKEEEEEEERLQQRRYLALMERVSREGR